MPSFKTIEVIPSDTTTIGADVGGVNFADVSDTQLAEILRALKEHLVLRFRRAKISDEAQVTLSLRMGPSAKHSQQLKGGKAEHPKLEDIYVVSNHAGGLGNTEVVWHTDNFYMERPSSVTMLKAVELSAEGNTYFRDMRALYDGLAAGLKHELNGRLIQHQTVRYDDGTLREGKAEPVGKDHRLWPHVRHPVVCTIPDTLRNFVYLGLHIETSWIVGLDPNESSEIHERLFQLVKDPKGQWVQTWEEDDLLMWLNGPVMHRRDAFEGKRTLHRTAVEGDPPVFIAAPSHSARVDPKQARL